MTLPTSCVGMEIRERLCTAALSADFHLDLDDADLEEH